MPDAGTRTVGAFEIRLAVAVLTGPALAAVLSAVGPAPTCWGTDALCGYAAFMLGNVFVPHVAATIALRRYMPGTTRAVLLNLPATALLLVAALREGRIAPARLAWCSFLARACILLLIAALFRLGRRLRRALPHHIH